MSVIDSLKDKVGDLMDNENVQNMVGKAKDFINTDEGREKINDVKEKVEDFVEEKTNGAGIFGFGKKDK